MVSPSSMAAALRIVLLLALGISLGRAEHYKLFVLTGQSNSLGTTAGGEPDPGPGSDPGDSGVKLFWHNVADASISLGDSGGMFRNLREQQGGFYAGSATHWGPEINVARTLYRAGVRNLGIVKASRGGGGNANWSKASGGHMYSHLVNTVGAATSVLTNGGDTFEIVGLLYLQGESDSGSEAAIADTRLSELIANLRADLPNAGNMQVVIGGVSAAGGNRDTVRAKQAALAAGDATVRYFDTVDLRSQLYDNLHFDRAAKLTVGERYAQAFLDSGVCSADFGQLVFIGDSVTQGGLGFPSYRYQVFKHLVDRSASYTFVGSVNGAHQFQNVSASTPDYGGQSFSNVHEGHWGWRAFWENGRVPLPSSRRSGNRGEGTVLNWTGQEAHYELGAAGNFVAYPDPGASGTGNTRTTYVPDTAVIMSGINDLAGGTMPTQLRDDIGTMIDQLRSANPNVRIHVNRLLYTNQGAAFQTTVNSFNELLQPLADAKNATSPTSPVWIMDASTGFDPVAMAHDNVHPNTAGEAYVGDRIAAGLGLIATPGQLVATFPPPSVEKEVTEFASCFAGNEIYNRANYINGWSEVTPAATTEALNGTILNRVHVSGAGEWLEGMASTRDGGTTTWNSGNDGDWTFEISLKFNANPAGIAMWLGTDTKRIIVELYADRTQDNENNVFNVAHNNLDGAFHTWRIAHDNQNARYHVWRDGVRLTPLEGAEFDGSGADSRVVLGDRTGGPFGNNYNVEIASICYDQTGAYLSPGADADADGMSDAFEYEHFNDITAANPNEDLDGDKRTNLEEFKADTDPMDASSFVRISQVKETAGGVRVTVPDSSVRRLYTLSQSEDLGNLDPWRDIAGPFFGTGGELTLQDPSGLAERSFYRVGIGLP